MTDTADTSINEPALVWLDPHELAGHPLNVRTTKSDVKDLVGSIRALGVLEPLVVTPVEDDGWRVIAGHRRLTAAIEAGQDKVPCVIRDDLQADDLAVAGMLVENLRRTDLTPIEEARGYQQLLDAGWSATKVARTTGSRRKHVKSATDVAANQAAAEAVDSHGLTLDEALVIVEFEDDPDALAALIDAAASGSGDFAHTAARLRYDRDNHAKRQATAKTLSDAGVTVIDKDDPDWPDTAVDLWNLLDEAGNPIEDETHAECPGHAAAVAHWNPEKVIYYCTDPGAYGHQHRFGSAGRRKDKELSEVEREQRRAERRTVREKNAAWRAATSVRHDYIRELVTRKRSTRTEQFHLLRLGVHEVMANPRLIGRASDDELAELLGREAPRRTWGQGFGAHLADEVTDARLPHALLMRVAADHEQQMHVHVWRQPQQHADQARWLAALAGTGYTLSAIEQEVVDAIYPPDVVETAADATASGPQGEANVVPLPNHQTPTDADEQPDAPAQDHPEPPPASGRTPETT